MASAQVARHPKFRLIWSWGAQLGGAEVEAFRNRHGPAGREAAEGRIAAICGGTTGREASRWRRGAAHLRCGREGRLELAGDAARPGREASRRWRGAARRQRSSRKGRERPPEEKKRKEREKKIKNGGVHF